MWKSDHVNLRHILVKNVCLTLHIAKLRLFIGSFWAIELIKSGKSETAIMLIRVGKCDTMKCITN